MFVGTVGEEELGNLRGVRALFRDHVDIDGFISIDGLSIGRIVNQATGSHRYEMTFKGPGGHSFQEFGRPSAIHAMGRAIAKIADVQTPTDPKTTFTVGTVQGGTSVNAIAAEARDAGHALEPAKPYAPSALTEAECALVQGYRQGRTPDALSATLS